MAFETETNFTLPKGFVDADGNLHKQGSMRLATAADEILPLKDPRVKQNPAYLAVIVLSRVITQLGSLPDVNTKVVEGLFASDLNYLQALYEEFNADGEAEVPGLSAGAQRAEGFGVMGEA